MNGSVLSINNEDSGYLDEKELFILFYLLKRKHISTMWSGVFVPNNRSVIHVRKTEEDGFKTFEENLNSNFKRMTSKAQSSIIFSYLLELGKELDEEGYSISCNANYALLEGGFLYSNDNHDLMWQYFEHILEKGNKVIDKKFDTLTAQQKKAVDDCILEKNKRDGKIYFPSSEAYQPINEYQEAIINKKADKDFIVLVNKLINKDDNGEWDSNDVTEFLSIYYRHKGEEFRKNVATEKTFLYEDYQTKLAGLIFEHADFHLFIKNTDKLKKYLSAYIDIFKSDKLNGFSKHGLSGSFFSNGLIVPLHRKLFGFTKQREILVKHIEEDYDKYKRNDLEIGSPFTEPEYIGDDKSDAVKITFSEINEEEELFLFVHTMLALEHEKYLEIDGFSYGTTDIFDSYDRGFLFKIKLNDKKYATEDKPIRSKVKSKREVSIENDFLCFGTDKIPVERGQKTMVELFLKNARVHHGDRLTQKGKGIEIAELQKVGGYKDKGAFRDGLKRLRTKIKNAKFPATIENPETGKYQISVKYQ